MSKPMHGNKAVDEAAVVKNKEGCEYVISNIHQLSKEVIMDLLNLHDKTGIYLKRALEWRLKQEQGGAFVPKLNKVIEGLTARVSVLETKVGVAVAEGAPESEAQASGDAQDASGSTEDKTESKADEQGASENTESEGSRETASETQADDGSELSKELETGTELEPSNDSDNQDDGFGATEKQ